MSRSEPRRRPLSGRSILASASVFPQDGLADPSRVASNPVGRQPAPALFARPIGHHAMTPANARSIQERTNRTNRVRIRNAPSQNRRRREPFSVLFLAVIFRRRMAALLPRPQPKLRLRASLTRRKGVSRSSLLALVLPGRSGAGRLRRRGIGTTRTTARRRGGNRNGANGTAGGFCCSSF